jgi:hypothetical protein
MFEKCDERFMHGRASVERSIYHAVGPHDKFKSPKKLTLFVRLPVFCYPVGYGNVNALVYQDTQKMTEGRGVPLSIIKACAF